MTCRGLPAFKPVTLLWKLVLGLFVSLSISHAAPPIIAAKHDDRILLKQNDHEMAVPVPPGYILTNHHRINFKALPSLQDRSMLAAFERRVDKSNEYQVEPEPGGSGALYYLVYVPRLDYRAATSPDLVSHLEQSYADFGFETVSETLRFAILRPDDNTLSVTWADLTPAEASEESLLQRSTPNCMHSSVYRKDGMVVMFDTIETCAADASSVKAHGEIWLQRIKSANEPMPYAQRLLAEKAALEQLRESEAAEQAQAEAAPQAAAGEQGSPAGPGIWTRIVWIVGGAVFGVLLWNLVGRLKATLEDGDGINKQS